MKALFFDFDGTLWIDGRMSDDCRRELRRVKNAGNVLILNTGRSPAFLPGEARHDELFDALICGSSYVEAGGRVLENLTLSREVLERVYRWGLGTGKCVVFEGVKENFSQNGGGCQDASLLFSRAPLPGITKVTMWCDPSCVHQEDFPGLRIVHFKNYAEGILEGRDKSSGMKTLLAHFGLSPSDAYAFGDSENDLDMLRYAGKSVCMASAPADFDEFCAFRASSKDGVPEALRELFKD